MIHWDTTKRKIIERWKGWFFTKTTHSSPSLSPDLAIRSKISGSSLKSFKFSTKFQTDSDPFAPFENKILLQRDPFVQLSEIRVFDCMKDILLWHWYFTTIVKYYFFNGNMYKLFTKNSFIFFHICSFDLFLFLFGNLVQAFYSLLNTRVEKKVFL